MKRVAKILKSIYNFFAGDLILLIAVAVAFGAAGILGVARHEENLLLVVILVGVIVIGIVTTIGRELGAATVHEEKEPPDTDQADGTRRG